MKIQFTKKFEKRFNKLSAKLREKTIETIQKFISNPNDESLYNHALKGKLAGFRSISVGGDLRIIFEEHDGYVMVIMITIGTHAQLYE